MGELTTEQHIATINDELGIIQVAIAIMQTDISWLKKAVMWMLGLLGSGLLAGVGYAVFN